MVCVCANGKSISGAPSSVTYTRAPPSPGMASPEKGSPSTRTRTSPDWASFLPQATSTAINATASASSRSLRTGNLFNESCLRAKHDMDAFLLYMDMSKLSTVWVESIFDTVKKY